MVTHQEKASFSSEAMLCKTFLAWLPEGWTAFAETGNFDLVLRRDADGVQVGIEAKLVLNTKVISQIVEEHSPWWIGAGPDFRAVLIPFGCVANLHGIARLLGITVIQQHSKASFDLARRDYRSTPKFEPELPRPDGDHWSGWRETWIDWAPHQRLKLPDYVPDIGAGHSAPVKLSEWKIQAIKLLVLLERRGYIVRSDFKALRISADRWVNPYTGWLARGEEKGQYIAGPEMPKFRAQHPKNYAEIEADFETWNPDRPGATK